MAAKQNNKNNYQQVIWHSRRKEYCNSRLFFKSNTNDTRESPAIKICNDLINEGAKLKIYDPKVSKEKIEVDLNLKSSNSNESSQYGTWVNSPSILDAIKGVDGIVIFGVQSSCFALFIISSANRDLRFARAILSGAYGDAAYQWQLRVPP